MFYRALWTSILGSEGAEDRNAIFNPKREAFWLGLLQEAADAGVLRADIELTLLLRTLDYAFRATMLHWVIGEISTAELQPAVGYAYTLALRGAASAQGLALLEKPLLGFQAKARARSALTKHAKV